MKKNIFIAFTLSAFAISCNNSRTTTTAEKVDSIPVAKTDSIISSPDTLKQENNTSLTTTITAKSKNKETQNPVRQTDLPCALPLVPRFPESDQAMIDFIDEHLQYPEAAKKGNITGTVLVGFKVKKTGELTDIKILKGLGYGCDEEAVRIVQLMPKWIPAKTLNEPSDADFSIPINFKTN